MSKRSTVVELFAGAGFLGSGFQKAGFKLKQAYELDPAAAGTYHQNLRAPIATVDVTKCTPDGSCDVLLAGPPCQGFSTLGKRGKHDPRNQLSMEVARWAKALRPKVVVIENVPQFRESAYWHRLTAILRRHSYSIRYYVLDSSDYGCPQYRRRLFTLASRIGFPDGTPHPKSHLTTVRNAWEGLSPEPDGTNFHIAPIPSDLALSRMQQIPPGGDKRDLMKNAPELAPRSWWKIPNQVTDVWGRMHWDRPCNTLRTSLLNPSKGRYIHPEQNRVITLREAARLHSIDDSWTFIGTPTHIARQIGNGVPPLVSQTIASFVKLSF